MEQLAFSFNQLVLLAANIELDCYWITKGKEYIAKMEQTDLATVIDDFGIQSFVHLGEYDYLNDYVIWEKVS